MYRRPARELHRRRAPLARRTPSAPRSRVPLVAGAAALVAVAVAVPLVVLGSARTPAPAAPPARYEVVYQVDNTSTGAGQQKWEVLQAQGPLDVSDLTYDADPLSGATPVSGTVTDYDGLFDLSGGRLSLVSHREPALGSGAVSLGVDLSQLYQWGLAQNLGRQRSIAGQPCRMVRLSEPPAGPLTALSGPDHDDVCLTSTGIELSETWTYGGRVVLTRLARYFYQGATFPPITGAPAASGTADTASDVIGVSSPAGPSFVADPAAPPGYTAGGSLSVTAENPQQTDQILYTASDWWFERGGALVTVEAGVGAPPWDDSGVVSRPEQLRGLGPAVAVLRSDGPQLQVTLAGGRWVAIGATLPLAQLVGYASTLRLSGAG